MSDPTYRAGEAYPVTDAPRVAQPQPPAVVLPTVDEASEAVSIAAHQGGSYTDSRTPGSARMSIEPISLDAANRFVRAHHRHSRPVIGHLYSLGLWSGPLALHGVAIVGRPVARHLDDGHTVEVTRLATDGTRNACSMLYGACCREARRRGYMRVVTYTVADETGASLRAAGFARAAEVRGRQWDTPTRRRPLRRTPDRVRWERAA